MWKCHRCGREFKDTEQDHFCVKPNSIDEYIAAQPEDMRPLLQNIREAIRAAAPEATEKISWQMPTFWQGENLVTLYDKRARVQDGVFESLPATRPKGGAQRAHKIRG